MDGYCSFNTMMMMEQHGKKPLHILLDSGSTHDFIDTPTAFKLNCKVEKVSPIWVKVADGGQLRYDAMTKRFEWMMQGYTFQADMLLLPLNGSDIVLGIHWFSTLGPFLWDFRNLTMELKQDNKKVKLRGAAKKKVKGILPELQELKSTKMEKLLTDYSDVFEAPTGLPPAREKFDHRIP
uniref:Uncharacterized protein n=1 Tax=Chenopodium quinoa TaxID=63459 RepID=A0A803MLE0_CHEQI